MRSAFVGLLLAGVLSVGLVTTINAQISPNPPATPTVSTAPEGPTAGDTTQIIEGVTQPSEGVFDGGASAVWLFAALGLGALAFAVGGATVARRGR